MTFFFLFNSMFAHRSFSKVIFAKYSVMFVLAASYKAHTFWWPLKNAEIPHGKRVLLKK